MRLAARFVPHEPGFNARMGGIIEHRFWPDYSRHRDTNSLSLAVFVQYGLFKILFPGDLEEAIEWIA